MSHEPSHATEHLPPPEAQAAEGISWFPVLGTGIGASIIFTIAVLIVFKMMHVREKELQPLGPDPMPVQIGQNEIGIVDQPPFDVSRAVQQYRDDRAERLTSWGWIDRKAGVIHMPIDRAMDLVVQEHRK